MQNTLKPFFISFYNKMSIRKFLNDEGKRIMLEMRKQGIKVSQIALTLGVREATIYAALKRAELRGTTARAKGSGRPKKLSPRTLRILRREVIFNRRATLAELTASLPVRVHPSTVRRALHNMGFRNRVAVRKPFLTSLH